MNHVFQVSMSDSDIRTIIKALKELPYKESSSLIRDFEKVLLTPLMHPKQGNPETVLAPPAE